MAADVIEGGLAPRLMVPDATVRVTPLAPAFSISGISGISAASIASSRVETRTSRAEPSLPPLGLHSP